MAKIMLKTQPKGEEIEVTAFIGFAGTNHPIYEDVYGNWWVCDLSLDNPWFSKVLPEKIEGDLK